MVMRPRIVQVPIDESGYGQKDPDDAFVFAGYGGPVKLWEDFTHEFDTILNEPPILTPHEFKKRARWRQRADERILRTVRKVEESTLNALIFTIGNDEFAKLARAMEAELGTPPPRFARNPYFFAFMATLVLLMGGARSQPDLKIQLIYDENLSERSALEHGYRLFREWATANYPALLDMLARDPIPQNDEDFSPLLIADLLAWHVHRDYVERRRGNHHGNEVWEALKRTRCYADEIWTAEQLLNVVTLETSKG